MRASARPSISPYLSISINLIINYLYLLVSLFLCIGLSRNCVTYGICVEKYMVLNNNTHTPTRAKETHTAARMASHRYYFYHSQSARKAVDPGAEITYNVSSAISQLLVELSQSLSERRHFFRPAFAGPSFRSTPVVARFTRGTGGLRPSQSLMGRPRLPQQRRVATAPAAACRGAWPCWTLE